MISIVKKNNWLATILSFVLFVNTVLLFLSKTSPFFIRNLTAYSDFMYFEFFGLIALIVLIHLLNFGKKSWIESYRLLVYFFPTASISAIGILISKNFHISFLLFPQIYFTFLAAYLISKKKSVWKPKKPIQQPEKPMRKSMMAFLILVIIINISFGIYHIEKFAAVDEPLWIYGRIEDYWNGIKWHYWSKTMISDKPGVTVALITGPGLIFKNPIGYKPIEYAGKISSSIDIEESYFSMRLPILLFCSLSLIFFYFILRQFLSRRQSFLSLTFISLSPLLIGMSRIINPDSLLWVFAPLSFFSYLAYLNNRQKRYLYLTAILLGLSLLTKYIANILLIYYFGIIFLEYISNRYKYNDIDFSTYLKRSLFDYFIIFFFAAATFFILCPATWVDPNLIFQATIFSQAFRPVLPAFIAILLLIILDLFILRSKLSFFITNFLTNKQKLIIQILTFSFVAIILFSFLNIYLDSPFLSYADILSSPKSAHLSTSSFIFFLADFYPLIFGIHPIILFALLIGIIKLSLDSNKISRDKIIILYMIIFIFLYYAGSVASGIPLTVRYQIILYPIVFVMSAMLFNDLIKYFTSNSRTVMTIYLATIIFLVFSLYKIHPLYSGYASGLLPNKYYIDLKEMGAGSYLAAQYLNSLPYASDINVWSDKSGVCYFFIGNCYTSFSSKKLPKDNLSYIILSSGRESRTKKRSKQIKKDLGLNLNKLYQNETDVVYRINIDNRPNQFVKVIKLLQ